MHKKFFCFLYTLLGVFLIFLCFINEFSSTMSFGDFNTIAIDNIENNSIVSQEFFSKYNNLKNVSLKFGTYNNTYHKGTITIKLVELDTNKVILEENRNLNTIEDNKIYTFDFGPIKKSKNKKYNLSIISKNLEENTKISIYGSKQNADRTSHLKVNGIEKDGSLALNFNITKTFDNLKIYLMIYILIGAIILIFDRKENVNEKIK